MLNVWLLKNFLTGPQLNFDVDGPFFDIARSKFKLIKESFYSVRYGLWFVLVAAIIYIVQVPFYNGNKSPSKSCVHVVYTADHKPQWAKNNVKIKSLWYTRTTKYSALNSITLSTAIA